MSQMPVDSNAPHLENRPEGLTLVHNGMEVRADFATMLDRIKPQRLSKELLVKAARLKGGIDGKTAIDATAGLGEDSLLLAAAGYSVLLIEQDPTIFALLGDALDRAREDERLLPVVERMRALEADSIEFLSRNDTKADVVLLDPMFPGRTKSAAVKKKFQLLQLLESPCEDEDALLSAAFAAIPTKIVVKRPAKGPYLAGIKPDYSLEGKAIRYDCYTPASSASQMRL